MKRLTLLLALLCAGLTAAAMDEMPKVELQIVDATSFGCGALNAAMLRYGSDGKSVGLTRCDGANALRGVEAGKFQLALIDRALIPASFQGETIPAFCEVLVAYVNVYNRVKEVKKEKLAAVWCGIRPAWNALGGDASDIHRYGITAGRPGGETVADLLKIRTPGMGIVWLNSTAEAVLYVSHDPAALALGRYQEEFPAETVRTLAVDGVVPDRRNVVSGKYPLMRRYVWAIPASGKEKVQDLLPYLKDDEFRRSLLTEDLLPE